MTTWVAPPTTESPVTEPTEPPPPPVPADPDAFTVTSDVVCLTQDGVEYAMDIYTPTSEGPRPVVLNRHGIVDKALEMVAHMQSALTQSPRPHSTTDGLAGDPLDSPSIVLVSRSRRTSTLGSDGPGAVSAPAE